MSYTNLSSGNGFYLQGFAEVHPTTELPVLIPQGLSNF